MEKQLIISVGREFGSAGHEIAQKLAEHYNIQLLDHNLLDELAAEKNLNANALKDLDEKHRNLFISRKVKGFSSSPEENLHLMQFDYLQKKAEKGDSFVVVGRCSESVLKKNKNMVSIFILGEKKKKVQRIMELYGLSESVAEKLMFEKDMKRKKYHNGFCEGKWGDSRYYDICINSSKLGLEKTVALLIDYIDSRQEEE